MLQQRKDRFGIKTLEQYMKGRDQYLVSENSHDALHGPALLVYRSKDTLDTTAGVKLRIPGGGQITRVSARVDTAPSSADMLIDLLIDGVSVFGGGYLTIPQNSNLSNPKMIERPYFNNDSNIKCQVNTIGGATGPYILTIEYIPGW